MVLWYCVYNTISYQRPEHIFVDMAYYIHTYLVLCYAMVVAGLMYLAKNMGSVPLPSRYHM